MSRQIPIVFFQPLHPAVVENHKFAQALTNATQHIEKLGLEIVQLKEVIAQLQQAIDEQPHTIQSLQERIRTLQREKDEQAAEASQQLMRAQKKYAEIHLVLQETQEKLKRIQKDPVGEHTRTLQQKVSELQLELNRFSRLVTQQSAQQIADRNSFYAENKKLRAQISDLRGKLAVEKARAQVTGLRIFNPIPTHPSPHSDTSAAFSGNESPLSSDHCDNSNQWRIVKRPQ